MSTTATEQPKQQASTSEMVNPATGKLILYWTVVLVPLAYGIYNTILKALPLFV
ncbi:MFS transporter small subunit [Thiohalorhabdus sp. Cl-TMA]|uniref:Oxalate:formate antiporter n=1 Tax=Thiohalorhabdus methylotrophus TaxID=3242694 RepID=A0ABV4TY31_9GAMM